ncbi:MAG: RNA polymerase sigma factor RpoE, partial [Candidatus Eisenbacteria sp.]|nr:RNA polymerase sigma factor RpoE [Candidatus Eisenbacteria bacterium]
MEISDGELVSRVQGGDREAFSLLADRWADRSYNLALSIVKKPEDAEDAVQEAFLKAYRSLPRFRHGSTFGTWLYRI